MHCSSPWVFVTASIPPQAAGVRTARYGALKNIRTRPTTVSRSQSFPLRRRLRKLTAKDVVAAGVEPMKNEASAAAGLQRIIERWKGEDGKPHLQSFSQCRSTHPAGHPRAPGTHDTGRHVYGGPCTLTEQLCQGSRTGLPQPLTTNLRGRPVEPTSFFGRVTARPFLFASKAYSNSCQMTVWVGIPAGVLTSALLGRARVRTRARGIAHTRARALGLC